MSRASQSDQVQCEIDGIIWRYRTNKTPSDSAHIAELRRIAHQAERLRLAITQLSARSSYAILEAPMVAHVNPLELAFKLRTLVFRAKIAEKRAPKPRRGPRRRDNFRRLIAELGILWAIEHKGIKGIVKRNGIPAGAMLDFIQQILREKQIRHQSRSALGEMLYGLRAQIEKHARTAQARARKGEKGADRRRLIKGGRATAHRPIAASHSLSATAQSR